MKIAVFASGSGSNFEAIVQEAEKGKLGGEVVLLFCDQPEAYALERAKAHGISAQSFHPKSFPSKQDYERAIIRLLQEKEVELIVLAGYMRLVGDALLTAYPQRILNIHPSLLPNFPGRHGIIDAFEAGVKETGVTVHYVDQGMDTGPVISQTTITIEETDTLASLEVKIHQAEHQLYPAVIKHVIQEINYQGGTKSDKTKSAN